MTEPQIIEVPFRDGKLLAAGGEYAHEGDRPVPLLPFCEGLGITLSPQLQKLKGRKWAVMSMIDMTGADGKTYKMASLPLRAIPMWLAGINPSKVKSEARAMLEAYQAEAVGALYEHFRPRMGAAGAALPPNFEALLRTAIEAATAPLEAKVIDLRERLAAIAAQRAEPEATGAIGPSRSSTIRRQLLVYGSLMGHGDAKATKSWRSKGDVELRGALGFIGSGRSWARLPIDQYGRAMVKLEEMIARARKVDVDFLAASQLDLKPTG